MTVNHTHTGKRVVRTGRSWNPPHCWWKWKTHRWVAPQKVKCRKYHMAQKFHF